MKVDRCFGAPAIVTRGCVLRNPDVPLRPSIDNFANDTYQAFSRCLTKSETEEGQGKLEVCDYGYMGSDATRIAFVGDSHAPRFVRDGFFPWNPARRATLAAVRQIGDVVLLRYALSSRFEDE